MKHLVTLLIILGIGVTLPGGCGVKPPVNATPVAMAQRVNLLVAVEGKVQLKREGWRDYVPTDFGTLVRPTDLLNVDGKVSVLCADLSIKSLNAQGRCPCPINQGWLEYHGLRFDSGQRAMPQDVPYILHPRNTFVLNAHPLLRWHSTGVSSYTVSIVSFAKEVWSQSDVVGDRLRYPDDAPALLPGVDYLLVVRANATGRASTEEKAVDLGFQLSGDAERLTVEQQRNAILGLSSLDEPARTMALAMYYLSVKSEGGRGLWGEAWLLLEPVAQTRTAPAVHLRMGEVLAAMKLPDEAETAYRAALQSAESLGDKESQAAAHAGLWRVTGNAADRSEAIKLYEELGDENAKTLQ